MVMRIKNYSPCKNTPSFAKVVVQHSKMEKLAKNLNPTEN